MASSNGTLLFAPAHELQQKLAAGATTSLELVEQCLAQIARHNEAGKKLKAILAVRPRDKALEEARQLDLERKQGNTRSSLHGIPVLIKDAIVTYPSLGMPTTAGSVAMSTLRAKRTATLVDQLRDAGLIILGKANMTEFCGLKSSDTPIGWSAYGGQTLSAYRRNGLAEKDQPWSGGSSSGSAVGISAGFAPLSIGTETSGSLVFPASVNGLYGLKLTRGSVATDGVFKLSSHFDCIGVMARDPPDLAALAEIILLPAARDELPKGGYASSLTKGWEGLSIGITHNEWGTGNRQIHEKLRGEKWGQPDIESAWLAAVKKMRETKARVVHPFKAADADTLKYSHGSDGQEENLQTVAYNEFPGLVEEFLWNFEENPNLRTLKDIIGWNQKHADRALPEPYTTQTELITALEGNMTPEVRKTTLAELQRLADTDGIGKTMHELHVDIVLAPSDSTLVSFAACAGWPIATVPLGNLKKNGQPWGFFAMARAGREDLLLQFMAAFHSTFPPVEQPSGLL